MTQRLPLADRVTAGRWMWGVIRTGGRRFAVMMLLFCLATLVGLVGPQVLGRLVEQVLDGTTTGRVDLLAGLFLAVLVAEALLTRAAHFRAAVFGEHLLAASRTQFVGHALRLPLGTIEAAGTGDLLSRATTDVDRLDETVRDAVPEITTALLALVLTAVAMVFTSPLLACGMLVAVPVIVLSTRWYLPKASVTLERMLDRWSGAQASLHESVQGARTIDALRLADRRVRHNERALGAAVYQEKRHRFLLTMWLPCLELAYLLPIVAILLLGAWAYARGMADLGTVTTIVVYAQAMSTPLTELLMWIEEVQIGMTALRRVLGVSEVPRRRPDPLPVEPEEPPGGVVVRNLRFAYTPGRDVLNEVNLTVPPGERLVIVGPSGAGKSTLGRLIAGVSVPDAGSIRIGGADTAGLTTERIREQVVLLTQEQHVFACTLRENLTLPTDATDERLHEVLETAGALPWVRELPDGLDTPLGPGGHPVPAGVAQQLALARVLLADPAVLVLDEATSLLDDVTSRSLERSLATVLTGRTVIAIAHRPHIATTADRVAVMEAGRIVELGAHEALLANGGSYALLHRAGVSSAGSAASAEPPPEDPDYSRSAR